MALQDDLNRLPKQLGNFLSPEMSLLRGRHRRPPPAAAAKRDSALYQGERPVSGDLRALRLAAVLYRPVREAIPRFKFQGHRRAGLLRPSAGRLCRPVVFKRV